MSDNWINKAHEIRAKGINKTIRFRTADLNVEIRCPYGTNFGAFKKYHKEFDDPDISIQISQEDINNERMYHPDIWNPDVSVNDERVAVTYDYGCLEPFVALKKISDAVIPFDTFLFHGAVVEKDGCAYMFAAPSGVGKTTRISLWLDCYPDSTIVNGDKPFIRLMKNGIYACGSPWAGKEGWNNNVIVPLRAIFFVERAENNTDNSVTEMSIGKVFPMLLQQVHYPKDPVALRKTIQMMQSMAGKVNFYKFRGAPTKEAVQLAYEIARPR